MEYVVCRRTRWVILSFFPSLLLVGVAIGVLFFVTHSVHHECLCMCGALRTDLRKSFSVLSKQCMKSEHSFVTVCETESWNFKRIRLVSWVTTDELSHENSGVNTGNGELQNLFRHTRSVTATFFLPPWKRLACQCIVRRISCVLYYAQRNEPSNSLISFYSFEYT